MRAILVGPRLSVQLRQPGYRQALMEELALTPADLKIGVDGGLASWIKSFGVVPDLAVGDWDSLKKFPPPNLRHLSLPKDKDYSDLHYAACAALNAGATELIGLGISGGRADHHLAMILDLSQLSRHVRIRVLDPWQIFYFFRFDGAQEVIRQVKPGATVSLFALGTVVRSLRLRGFAYQTDDLDLYPGSRGLSNIARTPTLRIRAQAGRLLAVILRH